MIHNHFSYYAAVLFLPLIGNAGLVQMEKLLSIVWVRVKFVLYAVKREHMFIS